MRYCVLLCVCVVSVLSEPEGYKNREPAPVVEKHGLQSVLPPCRHTYGSKIDASASTLVQSQTQPRILNQKTQHVADNRIEPIDSSYGASTTTNQIGGGLDGQAFASNSIPSTANYIPVSHVLPPVSYHSQSQGQAYNYQQAFSSQGIKQSHQSKRPVPPRHGPVGPLSPVQLPPSRPYFASSGGQSLSSTFGTQFASSSNHGAQISSSQFGGISHPSQTGGQQSSHDIGLGAHASNSNFRPQAAIVNYPSQYASSNFAVQQNNAGLASFSQSNNGEDHGLNGQLGHVIRETVANAPLDPAADKHIYVHIPPADLERDIEPTSYAPQYIAPPKKHYKIVFIKTPSYPNPNYSQMAAAATQKVDEKTLIYVLVKKPEMPTVEDLQQIQQTPYKSSKPEVYFIKYKTQKEGEIAHSSSYGQSGTGGLSPDQINLTTSSPIDQIDIRSGGSTNESPKHELYGVPLQ